MLRRNFFRTCVVLAAGLGLTASAFAFGHHEDHYRRGRKYKAPPPASTITVNVTRFDNGSPIPHAAVIFHPIEGDRDKGGLELKTDSDGKAVINVIPIGDTVRLQIIARGYQTYGQDFKNDKNDLTFDIRLKLPGQQYSIYQPHSSSDAKKDTTPQSKDQPQNSGQSGSK